MRNVLNFGKEAKSETRVLEGHVKSTATEKINQKYIKPSYCKVTLLKTKQLSKTCLQVLANART